jgi:HD-GYP domain-containing protein (c-di-GMP phosphodiesterase class II)
MRLDIVTNDAGDLVRREHARELGASVVVAIYRLARQAQLHDMTNQAFVRQLEQTYQVIGEYCLRSGVSVNILFAQKAVFVAGQLLKGSRAIYESAAELAEILEWCGGSELSIAKDVTQAEVFALAEAISTAMRAEKGKGFRSPSPKIRLRAVGEAVRLRGLEVERLPLDQRIARGYAGAVVVLRRFFDDLTASRYVLPRRIKRIAQTLVDLSAGNAPAFLGVTEARNANHDAAGRSVNTAILAILTAREVTSDRGVLAQIAMAAMMHDVGRPRALALASGGGPKISALASRLSEEGEDRLAPGTAAVLTALGRVNEPSITRTVIVFEALSLRRGANTGPVYRGARPPTLHARIVTIARRYVDLVTPEPGLEALPPEAAVATLSSELAEGSDRTVLRMLVAALGLYPVGTVVQLTSDEVGEVVERAVLAGRPKVRVAMDSTGEILSPPVEVDLGVTGEVRRIARVISVDGWKKAGPVTRPRPTPPVKLSEPPPSRSAVVTTDVRAPGSEASPTSSKRASSVVVPAAPPVPPSEDSLPGTTPSAVAEAMGRMIEEALRAGGPGSPAREPPAAMPPATIDSVLPGPGSQRKGSAPPPREWRIGDSPVSGKAAPENVTTQKELNVAAPPEAPPQSTNTSQPPTARGTLGGTPLAHVLVYMLDHGLSGSIVFREPDKLEHTLYFQQGAVCKVSIARPSARIGDELVVAGLVSRATINQAVEGARRLGLLLGEYLVGHDLVSRDSLSKALEAQIGSRVASVVNLLPETTYSFYRDVDFLAVTENEGVVSDPLNVILATVRAWGDRARIRATLARIAKHPLIFHAQSDLVPITFTAEERIVVDYIRDSRPTTSALFHRHLADDEKVSSLLYALSVTRQFAFKGQKGAPMGGRGAALPISIAPPAPNAEPVAQVITGETVFDNDFADDPGRESALPPEPVSVVAEIARKSRSPSQTNEVASRTPASEHRPPQASQTNEMGSRLPPPPSNEVRPRMASVTNETGSRLPPPPTEMRPRMASVTNETGSRLPPPLPNEVRPRMGSVTNEAGSRIPPPPPPTEMRPRMGSVTNEAGSRIPPPPPPTEMRPRMGSVTNETTGSRLPPPIPSERGSRLPPPPSSSSGGPSASAPPMTPRELANAERALEAMTHFRLAESALARNDLEQAERLAARAVTSDPLQPDYLALHAWVRSMSNTSNEGLGAAISTLSVLLADDPTNERALLYRGRILKRLKRFREAMRDFDRVLLVNPRHREAAQEAHVLKEKMK